MRYTHPTQALGYYRGAPMAGGQGSGMGAVMAGSNSFAAGQGPGTSADTGWHPTILYMFGLILVEMAVFGFISRHL